MHCEVASILVAAKENPPRIMAASFPEPDLLHAFGSVGRSGLNMGR